MASAARTALPAPRPRAAPPPFIPFINGNCTNYQIPKMSSKNENFTKEISEESAKLGREGGLSMEYEEAGKKLREPHGRERIQGAGR